MGTIVLTNAAHVLEAIYIYSILIRDMYNDTSQPPEPYFGWGRVCRGRIWSPNIWGPSLLGAEFVRARVCQGPSLLGAEMSRNRFKTAANIFPSNKYDLFSVRLRNT